MKHGKKPTRAQKQLIRRWGLNPENWQVERATSEETVIVHRYSGETRTIPMKEEEEWTPD